MPVYKERVLLPLLELAMQQAFEFFRSSSPTDCALPSAFRKHNCGDRRSRLQGRADYPSISGAEDANKLGAMRDLKVVTHS